MKEGSEEGRWWGGLRLREIDREKRKEEEDRIEVPGPRTRVKEEGRERRYLAEFFAKKETSIDKEQERQKERGRLWVYYSYFSQKYSLRLHLFDIDSHSQSLLSFFANFFSF